MNTLNLFTFGNCSFANKIHAETYEITPNARQDLDSYRDATGVLHRNALSHTASVIEFDTIPMYSDDFANLISSLVGSYINANERNAVCTYFDPESNTQKSGTFYLDSNWKVSIYAVWDGKILYNPVHFKFVEY